MGNEYEGLIAGGIECSVDLQDGSCQVETIFDLPSWIKKLFEELREKSRERHQAGEKRPMSYHIISVGSEQPFALLIATLSTYRTTSINPKYLSTPDWFYFSSSDINHICADVASRALRLSGAFEPNRAI